MDKNIQLKMFELIEVHRSISVLRWRFGSNSDTTPVWAQRIIDETYKAISMATHNREIVAYPLLDMEFAAFEDWLLNEASIKQLKEFRQIRGEYEFDQ